MGGIQVVFCGDFFQLPPVSTHTAPVMASARRFCFQSPLWGTLIEASFDLTVVYRQGEDHEFIEALNAVRRGELPESCMSAFRACVGRTLSCADGILPTQIFTHK
jgi:ATP-dependent DNA helicase PIF1